MTAPAMKIPQMSGSINPSLAVNTLIPVKRGRGRPRNGEMVHRRAGVKKWQPKKWKPIHEQVVALDCAGAPHAMIAVKLNLSVQYVSKICNTPQAAIIKRNALNQLVKTNAAFQTERLEHMQAKAIERVADVLEDDALYLADPFAVVDRAFKFLQNTGAAGMTKEKGDTHIHAGNITVNNLKQTAILELKDGLVKARESREKHKKMEAIDVTSPKVETGRME